MERTLSLKSKKMVLLLLQNRIGIIGVNASFYRVGSNEPTFSYKKGSSLFCIIIIVLTKVYGYPGLETVVWYIIFSVIKSLKIWKTAYWRTKRPSEKEILEVFFFRSD